MGGLFSKPEPMTMPEVKESPEVVSEAIKGEGAKPKKRKGRAETIVTGELEPITQGKTLLG